MVGASGAVAGVLGAYLLTYPRANVHVLVWVVIFFWIVTVPAWLLLGFWFAMQLLSGLARRRRRRASRSGRMSAALSPGAGCFCCCARAAWMLLQPQHTPTWATVPPGAMIGRRTFHRGSVPDAGSATPAAPVGIAPWE